LPKPPKPTKEPLEYFSGSPFQERVASILKERNRDALERAFKIQRLSNPATLVELSERS
jgi:hypothetical protein